MRSLKRKIFSAVSCVGVAIGLSGCVVEGVEKHLFSTVVDPRLEEGQLELYLSLAQPKDDSTTLVNGKYPALVYVHGGGWGTGTRGDYTSMITKSAERGYVAITVDYRLTNISYETPDENDRDVLFPWPAQIEDVVCAVSWLKENADTYNVDVNSIGIVGGSAGGQIALMLADAPSDAYGTEHCDYEINSSVKAVASWAGPADITTWWDNGGLARNMVRGLLNMNAPSQTVAQLELDPVNQPFIDAMRMASPIENATGDVPVLQLQGSIDGTVQPNVTQNYADHLDGIGRENQYSVFEGGNHVFNGVKEEADATMFTWFDEQLKDQ